MVAERKSTATGSTPQSQSTKERTMKSRQLFTVLVAMFLMAGCTHFQQTLIGDEQTYAPTKPEDVRVYLSTETPTRAYKEVGFIVADKDNPTDAVNFIKEKAAKMGADALLNCEVRVYTYVVLIIVIPIPIHSYIASGVAVKYTS
jgi:hypothetical protein